MIVRTAYQAALTVVATLRCLSPVDAAGKRLLNGAPHSTQLQPKSDVAFKILVYRIFFLFMPSGLYNVDDSTFLLKFWQSNGYVRLA